MDRTKASKEIVELFIRMVGRYNALERTPVKVSAKHSLYHTERHMLDKIGDQPGMKVTDFAKACGVTKGAVSQVVKKLESKGVVRKYRNSANGKEVLLELTVAGQEIYQQHKMTNEETTTPLLEELKKHPDDKVQFLITMFHWIDNFLEQSGKKMKERI